MNIVDRLSPNSALRPDGTMIDTLVLHYTELPLQESLDILSDATREHRVSAHYVLAEDGMAYRLVPEERIAWHAGRSSWRGREALNGASIGFIHGGSLVPAGLAATALLPGEPTTNAPAATSRPIKDRFVTLISATLAP